MATPSVAPTMRAVLTRPDAVPDRSGGSAATATPLTGAVFKPSPMPTTNNSNSTMTSGVASPMKAKASAPAPMHAMPAVITTRGPKRLFRWPTYCDTATKLADIGKSSRPAMNGLPPRTVWK